MDVLRLGFVPLAHAAPLLAAAELGFFERHGLRVRLEREVGWATVRERILAGELDAAQALSPMPLAMSLARQPVQPEFLTALVLTRHGNAIVLARDLWRSTHGTLNPASLRQSNRSEPLTFGVVYPHSTQRFLLQDWFQNAGLVPDRDYRIVVVPPPQMVGHLKAGHLDGFCVGEPWASHAVHSGTGVIAALSADLAPGHPEKVLLVRRSFATQRAAEHLALIRALFEACAWCAHPGNHPALLTLLADRGGMRLPDSALRPAITGEFQLGEGRDRLCPEAMVFHGPTANAPLPQDFAWISRHLDPQLPAAFLDGVYRTDLFDAAVHSSAPHSPPTHPRPSPSPQPPSSVPLPLPTL